MRGSILVLRAKGDEGDDVHPRPYRGGSASYEREGSCAGRVWALCFAERSIMVKTGGGAKLNVRRWLVRGQARGVLTLPSLVE